MIIHLDTLTHASAWYFNEKCHALPPSWAWREHPYWPQYDAPSMGMVTEPRIHSVDCTARQTHYISWHVSWHISFAAEYDPEDTAYVYIYICIIYICIYYICTYVYLVVIVCVCLCSISLACLRTEPLGMHHWHARRNLGVSVWWAAMGCDLQPNWRGSYCNSTNLESGNTNMTHCTGFSGAISSAR